MADRYRKLPSNALVTDQSRTVYNDTIDMLRWWKTQAQRTGRGAVKGIVDWDQSNFLIKNTTATDLASSYGVLGIEKALYTPDEHAEEFCNVTSLSGVEPTVDDHRGGRWTICLEPIPSGAIGRCCLTGVVPARVYVNSHTDKFCDVVDVETVSEESCYLGSGSSGAQILWWEADAAEANETIVWALVRLGVSSDPTPFELKTNLTPESTFPTEPNAWRLTLDSETGAFDPPDYESDCDLTVFDPLKKFRSLGYDSTPTGEPGARGFASSNDVVQQIQEQARIIYGTATAAVASGESSFYLSSVAVFDGGQMPPLDEDDELEITNESVKICSGAKVYAKLNVGTGDYVWDDSPCCT